MPVRGVNRKFNNAETVVVVVESGCGKSVTANAIMRLIPTPPGEISRGTIRFKDKEITALSEKDMRGIRGVDISMIFQDPMTALNPTLTIGNQLMEGVMQHEKLQRSA